MPTITISGYIVLEALVSALRKEKETGSIKIGEEEIKSSLLYLLRKTNRLNRILRLMKFNKVVGFKTSF